MRPCSPSRAAVGLTVALLAGYVPVAEAVDGVQLINQELALAGDVTPGDEPGFPVTITRAGSYRLSGNLRVELPYLTVVEITTHNVSLDLNGFTIQGPRDQCSGQVVPVWCTRVSSGVGVNSAGYSNTTVLNGVVRDMTGAGIWLGGPNSRIDRVTVTRNSSNGIIVGPGALVSNNIVTHNTGYGIARRTSLSLDKGTALAVGNVVQWNGMAGLAFVVMRDNVLWANNPGGSQVNSVLDAGGNVCDIASC